MSAPLSPEPPAGGKEQAFRQMTGDQLELAAYKILCASHEQVHENWVALVKAQQVMGPFFGAVGWIMATSFAPLLPAGLAAAVGWLLVGLFGILVGLRLRKAHRLHGRGPGHEGLIPIQREMARRAVLAEDELSRRAEGAVKH